MRQGASRHKLADRGDDLYETPACATKTLLRVEHVPMFVWEPCAGRGAISDILRDYGRTVIASDLNAHSDAAPYIETHRDFLMETQPRASTIVTNPPYKLANEMIRHGLALGCDVIVLLRLMSIEGAARSDLIDGHLWRIWAGIERLPTMHRDGWTGPKHSNSGAPFAWFVFKPEKRPARSPIELRRVSWRSED